MQVAQYLLLLLMLLRMDGWVRVLHPFNSISVISRRWKDEHERLCAIKRHLGLGRISPPAGFEPATPWSEVGSANRSATWTLPYYLEFYLLYSVYLEYLVYLVYLCYLTYTYFTIVASIASTYFTHFT